MPKISVGLDSLSDDYRTPLRTARECSFGVKVRITEISLVYSWLTQIVLVFRVKHGRKKCLLSWKQCLLALLCTQKKNSLVLHTWVSVFCLPCYELASLLLQLMSDLSCTFSGAVTNVISDWWPCLVSLGLMTRSAKKLSDSLPFSGVWSAVEHVGYIANLATRVNFCLTS